MRHAYLVPLAVLICAAAHGQDQPSYPEVPSHPTLSTCAGLYDWFTKFQQQNPDNANIATVESKTVENCLKGVKRPKRAKKSPTTSTAVSVSASPDCDPTSPAYMQKLQSLSPADAQSFADACAGQVTATQSKDAKPEEPKPEDGAIQLSGDEAWDLKAVLEDDRLMSQLVATNEVFKKVHDQLEDLAVGNLPAEFVLKLTDQDLELMQRALERMVPIKDISACNLLMEPTIEDPQNAPFFDKLRAARGCSE